MIGNARKCPRLKWAFQLQRLIPESRNASSSVTLQIQHQSQQLYWPQNPYKYICTSSSKTSIRNLLSILISIVSSIFHSLQNHSWYQSHLLKTTQEMAMSESENKDKMTIGETSKMIASAGRPGYTSLSISLKLTREIFLLWQTLLLPLLETHDLTRVLKEQAPPSTISNEKGGQVPNTDYKIWQKHDQAVPTLINNSLSEAVIFIVVGQKTAKDAWEALNNNYSSRSKSRIMNLQGRLHNTKKGNMSLESYIQIMRTIGDELQACGHNIEESDLTYAILNGLGLEYNSFYASINPQLDHLSYKEVITSFNYYDLSISKQIEDKTTKEFPPLANLSQSSQNWERNNSEGRNKGRGRNNGNRYVPKCQLCYKTGHKRFDCRERFNRHFKPPPQPEQQNQQGSWQSSHNNNNIHPQAHTANTQYQDSVNTNWYPDSGASHHVTADINNIQQSTPYTGPDQLYIGNGRGFQILSTSSITIHKNSHSLKLNNILHVPRIKKNLLSVKKFAKDNNIFWEFHPKFCVVKDPVTHQTLLKGDSEEGIYKLTTSPTPLAFIGERTSPTKWHDRLGHPHFGILLNILKKYGHPTTHKTL